MKENVIVGRLIPAGTGTMSRLLRRQAAEMDIAAGDEPEENRGEEDMIDEASYVA